MKCPWDKYIGDLVEWASILVVRKDAHGRYIPPDQRTDPKKITFTEKSEPTKEILRKHFSGEIVIGLYTINAEGSCRMGVVDIDRHDHQGSQEVNEKAAITLYDRAISKGFSAFLEDSNGRGGYKLWLIFSEPVPARWVRRFARGLVQDWKGLGLETEPEIFPKQGQSRPREVGELHATSRSAPHTRPLVKGPGPRSVARR